MMHDMDLRDLTRYLENLHCQERSAATIEKYERALTRFYHWLPEKKRLDKDSVIDYKNELTRKFAPARRMVIPFSLYRLCSSRCLKSALRAASETALSIFFLL